MPKFPYDEALTLARAIGVDLDKDVIGRIAVKKASNVQLLDSQQRAAKGSLGPIDGSRGMIDSLHHAANTARMRTLMAAKEMLEGVRVDQDQRFCPSMKAVLEVLPVSKHFTKIDLSGEMVTASEDFEALYNLSRLAYADKIDEPSQLDFWQ